MSGRDEKGVRTRLVGLSDDELALLDGRCREAVQSAVDEAKARLAAIAAHPELSPALAGFVADVVSEARTKGHLRLRRAYITTCPICGRNDGYVPHKRSSRYHLAGEPNYDRPRTIGAVELAVRFVTVQHHVTLGCCDTCWTTVRPAIATALEYVAAEIPETITGYAPRYRRFDKRQCTACGWEGHEGQMRRLPTLMGSGTYAGGCPQCSAENRAFGPSAIKTIDGFVVVPIAVASDVEGQP